MSIHEARQAMWAAFERDTDFRESYILNIACMLLDAQTEYGTKLDLSNYQVRRAVAQRIFEHMYKEPEGSGGARNMAAPDGVAQSGEGDRVVHTLHIYAQAFWHDAAYIVGTPEALLLLREAIDTALRTGHGRAECFVCDGEGYFIEVKVAGNDKMETMVVPYTDEVASERDAKKVGPWSRTVRSENESTE